MKPAARRSARDRHRILYVINDLDMGGAQRVLLHQASHLDRKRFNVRVGSLELIANGKLVPEFEQAGVRVQPLREARESKLAGWGKLERMIVSFRPDLVHTHLAAAGVFGRILARRCGVKRVVSTFHNLSDWEQQRGNPVRWLDRRTLGLADALVAVSDAVRKAIADSCPAHASRLVTVHNGVPIPKHGVDPEVRSTTRARLGYRSEHFVVGTAARLDPRKGIDVLIDAFSLARLQYPNLRLLILGEGPERGRLAALLDRYDMGEEVQMLPHQSPIAPYMAAMDLFAAPSRTEGLGVAVIEALAIGVPVIASRVGGLPEILEDGKCGRLLPPGRADIWAECICDVVSYREMLEEWARAAPQYASRFSVEASEARLVRLYDELLEDASHRPEALAA